MKRYRMSRLGTMFSVLLLFAGIAVTAQPASAIVDGQRDEVHTNVGLVRFTTADGSVPLLRHADLAHGGAHGGPLHRGRRPTVRPRTCSSRSTPTSPSTRWQPASRRRSAQRAPRTTSPAPHTPIPVGTASLSISKQHDQGVVVLDAPAATKWPGIKPAPLLPVGTLDANQGSLKNRTFTLVGYGVDIGAKKAQIVVTERRSTTSLLKTVQTEVVTFQINANNSTAEGGSCFGDSGGPVFLGQFVVGDSSFVNSLTCNATGGYQRVDTAYSRAFLNQFL